MGVRGGKGVGNGERDHKWSVFLFAASGSLVRTTGLRLSSSDAPETTLDKNRRRCDVGVGRVRDDALDGCIAKGVSEKGSDRL